MWDILSLSLSTIVSATDSWTMRRDPALHTWRRARKKQEMNVYMLPTITIYTLHGHAPTLAVLHSSPPSLLTPPILIDLRWSSDVSHFSLSLRTLPSPHPPVLGWTKWHPQLPPQRCQCQLNQTPQKDSFLPAPVRCACLCQQRHDGGFAQPTGHETNRMTTYLILLKTSHQLQTYSSCWKVLRSSLSGS